MSVRKVVRRTTDMIEREGASVIDWGVRGSSHLFFEVKAPGKRPKTFIHSSSSCSIRGALNFRSEIRRYING